MGAGPELISVIVEDGALDASFRALAMKLANDVAKSIAAGAKGKSEPGPKVVFKFADLSPEEEKLVSDLELVLRPIDVSKRNVRGSRSAASFVPGKVPKVVISFPVDDVREWPQEKWAKSVEKFAKGYADEKFKSSLHHELIHYFDWTRARDPAGMIARQVRGQKSRETNYNSPMELNAYIQQGLTKLETYLKGANGWGDVEKIAGTSANELYDRVIEALPRDFVYHLNDVNKKKLKKRVARMWDDLVIRFGHSKGERTK